MELRDYLESECIDREKFLEKCNICRATLQRYLKGERPSIKNAQKIEEVTKGKVTAKELRGVKNGKRKNS